MLGGMIKSGAPSDFHVPRPYTSPDQCYGTKTDRNFSCGLFIPLFYNLNIVEFNMALVAQDTMDSDTSDADVTGAADYNEGPVRQQF